MIELYLRLIDRVLTPILLLLSVVILLRGHDLPGGGFIAGLLVSAAVALQILGRGAESVLRTMGRLLQPAIALGLLTAVGSALYSMIAGEGFFKSIWWTIEFGPVSYKIGTPVIFDIGVFLAVFGVTVTFLLSLSANVIEAPPQPFPGQEDHP